MSFHKANTDTLPEGWMATPLADLVSTKAGNSKLIKGKMHQTPASSLYQGFSASGPDVWSDSYEYDADGVVVSAVGARCGKSFFAKGKWVAVANTHVVLPFEDAIDTKFLWYGINDEDFWIKSGTAQPFVVVRKSFERLFAIPPRAEQTRIVEKLEELLSDLDAGVAELKAAQKKLGQYRQSLLKAAVEGALTAEWRKQNKPNETGAQLLARILTERRTRWEAKQRAKFAEQGKPPPKDWQQKYPEPVQPDTSNLPELPEGWVWASVEQLGQVQLGRQRSPSKVGKANPTPYIRAANITEDGVDLSDVLEMDFSETEKVTFALKVGDVLLTEASGSPEHVGRPAIWKHGDGLFCFQNTVLRFSPDGIGSEYAFYSFLAMQKLGVFSKLSGGVGINHLSAGKFSKLPVPLPPISEQQALVESIKLKFGLCDEQLASNAHSIKQAVVQHQNILRTAFSGQLVPQDPDDEPASVLLERIRAERAARNAVKQPRGRKMKEATI